MKSGTILIILALITVGIILFFVFKKNKGKNKCFTKNPDGSLKKAECSSSKCYHSNPDGSLTEISCDGGGGSNKPLILDNYAGKWIKAKYDGTKLYDDELNVVATYMAGEDIGRLGGRATGYACCQNNDKFYKILETSYPPSGFCGCERIMSDVSLKQILGIS